MPRYAAFLRGVMPVNAKMPDLKKAFEAAGFTDVKTILGSGSVVFSARAASEASLERRAEAAMTERLGRTFLTIIRPIDALRDLLASDPYRAFRLAPGAKRVVTFLRRRPTSRLALPIEFEGADRKSTRLNSSHSQISYAVFCLKKKRVDTRAQGSYHRVQVARSYTGWLQ